MRLPPLPQIATITNTGAPVRDPVTSNELPGASTTVTVKCLLQQRTSERTGEDLGQFSAESDWFGFFTAGTPITTASRITALGRKFVVVGAPATQETFSGPSHMEVQLKYVSDLQE